MIDCESNVLDIGSILNVHLDGCNHKASKEVRCRVRKIGSSCMYKGLRKVDCISDKPISTMIIFINPNDLNHGFIVRNSLMIPVKISHL